MSDFKLHDHTPIGWNINLYPNAGEASGYFVPTQRSKGRSTFIKNPGSERSNIEASRRAKAKVRRYCAENKLNRLGTLTYAGDGCHDQEQIREDLGLFFKRLRADSKTDFPYVWVPEWHKTDHGLHAHFAVGRYIPIKTIKESWGHGFVHIKLLSGLPVGSGALEESRLAANYLGKYVSKSFLDEKRIVGRHRYDLAQGFTPKKLTLNAKSKGEIIQLAVDQMKAEPKYSWFSDMEEIWAASPAFWIAW